MPEIIIQGLWIGNKLSTLEQLSIHSFLANGHPFHLYTYGPLEGVPAGTEIKDANTILPPPPAGTILAKYADIFRYKLLLERGQWWADLDTICLRTFSFPQEIVVGLSAGGVAMNGVMRFPSGHTIIRQLYERASVIGCAGPWNEIGPALLTNILKQNNAFHLPLPMHVFYPTDSLGYAATIQPGVSVSLDKSYAIHFYNECFKKLDKNKQYASSSLYEMLKRRYMPSPPPKHKFHFIKPSLDFNFPNTPVRSIELEITHRCNRCCIYCDRMVGMFTAPNSDMTMDQIERFCQQVENINNSGGKIHTVHVMGGEPLVHPNFQSIWELLWNRLRIKGVIETLDLVTNGSLPIPENVVKYQGSVSFDEKLHSQFYIAPVDMGKKCKKCFIPAGCGIGVNAFGVFPCGAGGSVIRLLGFHEMIRYEIPRTLDVWNLNLLCPYCAYSVPGNKASIQVSKSNPRDIRCSISYANAFPKYKERNACLKRF